MSNRFSTLQAALLASFATMGSAAAADIVPAPPPPPYVAPVFDWTGHYVGGFVGYGWSDKEAFDAEEPEDRGSYEVDGFILGLEAGSNWQHGSVLFGIEADITFSDMDGAGFIDDPDDTIATEIDTLATFTGRLGLPHGQWLPYFEGGFAWVDEEHTFADSDDADTVSDDRFGGLVGGGVEVAIHDAWSIKAEYNYIFLDSETYEFDVDGEIETITIDQDIQTIKFGVNYRF